MRKLLFIICIALFDINSLSAAQKLYQIVDLGLLNFASSDVSSINNKGQVCGTCHNEKQDLIFVWDEEKKLKTAKPDLSTSPIINNNGLVFGSWITSIRNGGNELNQESVYQWKNPFDSKVFLNFVNLGYPKGRENALGSGFKRHVVWDANDQNQILIMNQDGFKTTLGSSDLIKKPHEECGFIIWIYDNGSFIKINNDQFMVGLRINNNSQVLGCQYTETSNDVGTKATRHTKAAVYDLNSKTTYIFQFPSYSLGVDINDKGQVAGVFYNQVENALQGFLGDPASDLLVFEDFYPKALNNNGQITGTFMKGERKNKPALWDNGVLLHIADITDLVDDQGNTWDSIDALRGINDQGCRGQRKI